MIPNPTPTTFILLILGVSISIFIMLLPAFFELKKPKDAGPRKIVNAPYIMQPRMGENVLMANLEEDYRFSQLLLKKILDVIAALPNLETSS
jgi:hypothetical protein